jgi:hypothetical protein
MIYSNLWLTVLPAPLLHVSPVVRATGSEPCVKLICKTVMVELYGGKGPRISSIYMLLFLDGPPAFHVLTCFQRMCFATVTRYIGITCTSLRILVCAYLSHVFSSRVRACVPGMYIYLSHGIWHVSIACPLRVSPSWNSTHVLRRLFSVRVSQLLFFSCL